MAPHSLCQHAKDTREILPPRGQTAQPPPPPPFKFITRVAPHCVNPSPPLTHGRERVSNSLQSQHTAIYRALHVASPDTLSSLHPCVCSLALPRTPRASTVPRTHHNHKANAKKNNVCASGVSCLGALWLCALCVCVATRVSRGRPRGLRMMRPSLLSSHTRLPTSLPVGRSVRKDGLTVHAQPDSRKGATPLSERQKALAAAAYLHSSRRGGKSV